MKSACLVVICCLLWIVPGCRRKHPRNNAVSEIVLASDANRDRIVRGVYPGGEGWRWTAPDFAFRLDPPPSPKPAYLEMDFVVPDEFADKPPVTVTAKINGVEVRHVAYQKPGRNLLACQVPAAALERRPAEVEFTADRSFTDGATQHLQGLIVISVGLKEYEQTAEYRDAEMAKSHKAYEEVLKQRHLQVPLEKQREMVKLFNTLAIWDSVWFQNVRIIKNPLDLWVMQQIAYEVRPDFVIETGTWYGGSALYWAHTLNGMGQENARVLTVDVQDLTNQGASSNPLWKKYIEFTLGSSTDPRIVAKFAQRVKGWRVIVNLDSDHSMHHVLDELHMYAPLVNLGSYIAVEDTDLDGIPTHPEWGPGPMAAVNQFLKEDVGKDFEQDFTRESFVMTSYPGGWLRRKQATSAR